VLECRLLGERAVARESAHLRDDSQRVFEVLRREPRRHVSERCPEGWIVAGRDEVERAAHDGRLEHVAAQDRPLQRRAAEACEPRPEPDVWRGRPLRLHPDETLDRHERGEPAAL
jgi:hypothetical protein